MDRFTSSLSRLWQPPKGVEAVMVVLALQELRTRLMAPTVRRQNPGHTGTSSNASTAFPSGWSSKYGALRWGYSFVWPDQRNKVAVMMYAVFDAP